jgi:hypothetical protein
VCKAEQNWPTLGEPENLKITCSKGSALLSNVFMVGRSLPGVCPRLCQRSTPAHAARIALRSGNQERQLCFEDGASSATSARKRVHLGRRSSTTSVIALSDFVQDERILLLARLATTQTRARSRFAWRITGSASKAAYGVRRGSASRRRRIRESIYSFVFRRLPID